MTTPLTEQVKEELTAVVVPRQSARAAELAAILRFAGELDISGDNMSYELELESHAIARRVITALDDLYGIAADSHFVGPAGTTKKSRVTVRISTGAKELTRRLGPVSYTHLKLPTNREV